MPTYNMYNPSTFSDGVPRYKKGIRVRYIMGMYRGKIGRIVAPQRADTEAYIVRLERNGDNIVSSAFSFLPIQERSNNPWVKRST